ncbi:MAG: nicotinate (nicotinamide) nucleotide adenylyltransferase [Verrucomicrobiales bacterium]|nr:nicotinate (nicotinamide) nucleotide adenylyltransferase [Verrucomicrobiota bacterium JB025]
MTAPHAIALFGGTFDPVHLGHIHLATLAKDACALDQVRFLPCRISPHKTGSSPTPAPDRVELLRLATRNIPWAVVDDCETRRHGPSFSYLTAEETHARFPGARLFWIMGGDQWDVLPTWRNAGRLAELVEFIVLARGSELARHDGFRHHLVRGAHPASASAIRQSLLAGESSHPWLDPQVAERIREKQLYRK